MSSSPTSDHSSTPPHENEGHHHKNMLLIRAHGSILFATFSCLLPLAVFIIRSRSKKAFVLHWSLQAGSATASAAAILVMLVRSWTSIMNGTAPPHKIFGFVIFICLFVQAGLGYSHHVLYVELKRQTIITSLHNVLGWFIMCGGWVNTGLGLQMAGWQLPVLVLWMVWLIAISTLILFAATIFPRIAEAALGLSPRNEHRLMTLEDEESRDRLL